MKKNYNLCSHLVLPMYNMSLKGFGKYFIESYLLNDRKHVVIVIDHELANRDNYVWFSVDMFKVRKDLGLAHFHNRAFVDGYYVDGRLFIVHDFTQFSGSNANIQLIIDGKYSQISDSGFEQLIRTTTLPFKAVNPEGKIISDRRLIACCKDPVTRRQLRDVMERELEVTIPKDAELLSKMSEDCFADSVVDVIRKYSPYVEDDIQKYSPKFEPLEV